MCGIDAWDAILVIVLKQERANMAPRDLLVFKGELRVNQTSACQNCSAKKCSRKKKRDEVTARPGRGKEEASAQGKNKKSRSQKIRYQEVCKAANPLTLYRTRGASAEGVEA